MSVAVSHTFVSAIADDPTSAAAGEVLPSHWNASHTVTGLATVAGTGAYSDLTGTPSLATVAISGSATDLATGTLPAARMPAHTGDVTTVAGAVATTLATVNSNVGSFTNASITVNAKGLVTAASSGVIAAGYIGGCQLSWVSASAVDVGMGYLYVEGLSAIVAISALTHATGLALGNSAWGYCYAYVPTIGTTPTLVVSTVTPAAPFAGTARSASATIGGNAANLHRFLGAVKTDSSGNIIAFVHDPAGNLVLYTAGTDTTFRFLAAGAATAATAIDCSGGVPSTTRLAFVRIISNTTFGGGNYLYTGVDGVLAAAGTQYAATDPGFRNQIPHPLSSAQKASYFYVTTGGSGYFEIWGYYNLR